METKKNSEVQSKKAKVDIFVAIANASSFSLQQCYSVERM
jgi:hypothetical protein